MANTILRSVAPRSAFEDATVLVNSTISWDQGDLLYLDTVNNLLKPVVSDATAATVAGVARQKIVLGKLVSPYAGTAVDAAQASGTIAGPQVGVIAKMKLKVGDAFVPGAKVYATATDPQTVSVTGTNAVGLFQDAAITGVAGATGAVLVVANLGVQI